MRLPAPPLRLPKHLTLSAPLAVFLSRKALKDFTFSDGTFVPKGSYVSTANVATHHAADVFADPFTFDPWRFANMRDETGEGTKHQMVNTSKEFLAFGLGKHAW